MISRSEPDLPLAILRARNELTELTADDLRFTHPETEEFMRQAVPAGLSPGALAQLEERTEGWAAGLRLAALALQGKTHSTEAEQAASAFSGSHRYVAEYLVQEAFANQPEGVQTFLMRTSFLNRLSGPLCDAVTGRNDGTQMLDRLTRANLFITQLDSRGEPAWYRYHPLFAETLRYTARQRLGDAAVREVHEKASEWYEGRRMLAEAIEAALQAGLYERAALFINRYIDLHNFTEFHTLRRWAAQIPGEILARYADLCFNYALVILFSDDRYSPATVSLLDPLLRTAEEAWQREENEEKLGEVHSVRGMIAWWQGDLKTAFDRARQALDLLPENNLTWRGVAMLTSSYQELYSGRLQTAQEQILEARALLGAAQNQRGTLAATQILSEVYFWQGDMEQVVVLSQQVSQEATGSEDMLDDQGSAALTLGQVAYEHNDLDESEAHARRALDAALQRKNEFLEVDAAILLAQVLAARGIPGRAQDLLRDLAARIQHPSHLRKIQTTQASISLRLGDTNAAKAWRAAIAIPDSNILPLEIERERLLLARLLRFEGRADETLDFLKGMGEEAAREGRARSEAQILCAEALSQAAAGSPERAAQALTRALSTGQAKGFRRLLLDEGDNLAALIQDLIARPLNRRPLLVYATTLLQAFSREHTAQPASAAAGAGSPPAPIEPLSPQELRVLRLLAAGLSNPDIARELVVSTNTIKTQVRSIYRKLNISSREEAREAAYELKLL